MAVQALELEGTWEPVSAAKGNQHRKQGSIVCRAFLGVFLIWWRLL